MELMPKDPLVSHDVSLRWTWNKRPHVVVEESLVSICHSCTPTRILLCLPEGGRDRTNGVVDDGEILPIQRTKDATRARRFGSRCSMSWRGRGAGGARRSSCIVDAEVEGAASVCRVAAERSRAAGCDDAAVACRGTSAACRGGEAGGSYGGRQVSPGPQQPGLPMAHQRGSRGGVAGSWDDAGAAS